MTVIGLVRHGQTDWNLGNRMQGSSDIPLNDTGRAQAAEAGELLASADWAFPWTGVLTSPLVRAVETGQIIAAHLGLPMLGELPGIVERHYGIAEGMPVDEAYGRYPDRAFPESETEEQVTERALATLAGLHADYPGQHLLVVAHGGLIRNVLTELHDEPVPGIINSAAALVRWRGDAWLVEAINNELLTPAR
ncbi:histidine phosphatase family protein [Cryobacterium tepidiphilum]|uniref:Histidine phosphatase family protein n=1 Tax=Cryobacterium tepidiphilum TaxID=2486026 RepID=A0A3M8LF42_9MICO|nr:histidine phosphatase family protein [Cryobacterium tepidiphilum]RNE64173.1 histidine phosphatase family protein [Cryobacterium tepidiphilum]